MINDKCCNIVCKCGKRLYIEQLDREDFRNKMHILVAEHKCLPVDKDLRMEIMKRDSTIQMYKTKLENFKAFANILKGDN